MAAPSCRSSLRPLDTGRASHVVSVNSTTVRTSARAMLPTRVICTALVLLTGSASMHREHVSGTPTSKWPAKQIELREKKRYAKDIAKSRESSRREFRRGARVTATARGQPIHRYSRIHTRCIQALIATTVPPLPPIRR